MPQSHRWQGTENPGTSKQEAREPAPQRTEPVSSLTSRNAAANPLSSSLTQVLRLQRRYGNRAVRELIQGAPARESQREGRWREHHTRQNNPVQRKFDFLAEADLTKSLDNGTAEKLSQMVDEYNRTPDWRGLASDELLQKQVEADKEALTAMQQLVQNVHNPIKAMQRDWQANVYPLLKTIAAHQDALKKETEMIARRAEAAKPLRDRHLKGEEAPALGGRKGAHRLREQAGGPVHRDDDTNPGRASSSRRQCQRSLGFVCQASR